MTRSVQVIGASVLVAALVALIWLKAPLVPTLVGALGAGVVLYLRSRHAAP